VTINKQKDLIQENALKLSQDNQNIVLEWATGTGKTFATVKIVEYILSQNNNATGLLVCKESTHLKNWKEEISKHKKDFILDNVDSLLYASLHKLNKVVDFIILDECHAITDKRATELVRLIGKNTKLIFLSATIPVEKKTFLSLLSRKNLVYYTITLLDAIDMKLLPTPKVIIHDTKLKDDNKRSFEFTMNKGKKPKAVIKTAMYKDRWKMFNQYEHIQLNVLCNELEYYNYLTEQMESLDNQIKIRFADYFQRMALKNKFLNVASRRKKFIAEVKTDKAREILKSFKGFRHICFTGSIEQSLELGGNSSVNSKNHKKVNQELIDGFNSKMYSMLFAVNMLREGMNLTEIEKGLIIQLDSTVGSYLQMLGRMLRHEFPEIHLIRLVETQDNVYFKRAMSDFSAKFVEYR
jgi:superfamily II DNA or RNA helicase